MRVIFAPCVAFILAACGPGGGEGGSDGGAAGPDDVVSIAVTPEDAMLSVVDDSRPTQTFTAVATFGDGHTEDVTDRAAWAVAKSELGTFTGSIFEAGGAAGGQSPVQAAFDGVIGEAAVTVRVVGNRVEPPAPDNAPDLFGAASDDPSLAPAVAYPEDQTLVPPNLGNFEVHWTDATTSDLYEVAIITDYLDLRVYASASAPAEKYAAFSPSEWRIVGLTHPGEKISVSVSGLSSSDPSKAGTSEAVEVEVSEQDVRGGLYYWAPQPSGIYRHDFEKPEQEAELYYEDSSGCVGCHMLSRDGTKMAITRTGGGGPGTILDVSSKSAMTPTDSIYWNMAAFSPSGDLLLTTTSGTLNLRDPDTAEEISTLSDVTYATHPEWSPDGGRIAYTEASNPQVDWRISGGTIVTRTFDPGAQTFGPPETVVDGSLGNAYYPSFSPDSQWILFNVSEDGSNSYYSQAAELYAVKVDGSVGPLKLESPNVAAGLTNSWPKWAPFEQEQGIGTGSSETFFWFTFSSTRTFGVRGGGQAQIWMAPFFPGRAESGGAASAPAFRLPFQSLATSNHSTQWTERVVDVD